MVFTKWMHRFLHSRNRLVVVTFTGGMGAQIISAAIYFLLRSEGQTVYADLSYFDIPERVATIGNPGEISHWPWQLEQFGLTSVSFEIASDLAKHNVEIVKDGPQKIVLGLKALRQPEVQKHFAIASSVDDILPAGFSSGYLCIHIRRGDYVNVASHLITDIEFIELASKFAGLVKNIVVVSDSPIDKSFRHTIALGFERVVFKDNIDAFTTHRIMRNARILICSNSQFSLIAALLNPQALVVLPKQWFGQNDRAIEVPIHEACNFQILSAARV